jgi:peptide-methionine (S)-S-oxide reductase
MFPAVPGVVRCCVGYASTTVLKSSDPVPTYQNLRGFTESIQVVFDPSETSLSDLLDVFFSSHRSAVAMPRQYMSAIFFGSKEQKAEAKAMIKRLKKGGRRPATVVKALGSFVRAEDYHQKWYLRKKTVLMVPFEGLGDREFEDSSLASKLNAVAAGNGFDGILDEEELEGLPEEVRDEVSSLVSGKTEPVAGVCRR